MRGRVGLRTPVLTLAVSGSDFGRPAGGYTTLPAVQIVPLDATEEERLEIERRLTAQAPSNRVQGAGVEGEFRPARGHSFGFRAGTLRLRNAAGLEVSGAAGEAWYAMSVPRRATLNVRWREMPSTLQGLYIPGDEVSADGTLRLLGDLRLVGRAFRTASDTFASDFFSSGRGGSGGLRFMRPLTSSRFGILDVGSSGTGRDGPAPLVLTATSRVPTYWIKVTSPGAVNSTWSVNGSR